MGANLWAVIAGIGGWLMKNTALLVGIIEAMAKLLTGIISLTPTKKDDLWLPKIDAFFSAIKKFLYGLSDKIMGNPTV